MLPRYDLTVWFGEVEIELAKIEEKMSVLDAITEWSLEQEIEYEELRQEKVYLEKKYNELYEVLA